MTVQTIQIELPGPLLERASVHAVDEARELVTFLLEEYVQELEKNRRNQAYEAYYDSRTPEEVAEEGEILADFTFSDAEIINEEMSPCRRLFNEGTFSG